MKTIAALGAGLLLTAALLPATARSASSSAPAASGAADTTDARVARGAYLVEIMACNDCHTPWKMGPNGPEADRTRLLSGHQEDQRMPPAPKLPEGPWGWVGAHSMTAFSGPWGTSFTANLTPDKETGLGLWTEQMFLDTVRTARHQGRGRQLLPPMPIQILQAASEEDLKAIFAYLQSIPPIRNRVPQPIDPPEAGQE